LLPFPTVPLPIISIKFTGVVLEYVPVNINVSVVPVVIETGLMLPPAAESTHNHPLLVLPLQVGLLPLLSLVSLKSSQGELSGLPFSVALVTVKLSLGPALKSWSA